MTALLYSANAHAGTANPSKFGVYEGAGCNGITAMTGFQQWSGHNPARALDFLDDTSWTHMVTEADWMLGCWGQTAYTLTISVPMLPADKVSTLAQGAAGNYDTYFSQLATKFVKAGRGNAIIRLGWEMNGNWFAWAASKDPASYIAYWHRIVSVMRAVPGANFSFDWCPNAGWDAGKTTAYYPGDAYVDIIGLDVYNEWWNTADKNPQTRWTDLVWTTYGLYWQKNFAAQHGKQISYPEWGTGTRPDGHGGGDDAYFMQQMLAWMNAAPNLAYNDYWDYAAADYNAKLSNLRQPFSGAEYLKDTGPWSTAALAAAQTLAKNAAATTN